jgi:hypothetical protein
LRREIRETWFKKRDQRDMVEEERQHRHGLRRETRETWLEKRDNRDMA